MSQLFGESPGLTTASNGGLSTSQTCEVDRNQNGGSQLFRPGNDFITISKNNEHEANYLRAFTRHNARQERLTKSQAQNYSCENCKQAIFRKTNRAKIHLTDSEWKDNKIDTSEPKDIPVTDIEETEEMNHSTPHPC